MKPALASASVRLVWILIIGFLLIRSASVNAQGFNIVPAAPGALNVQEEMLADRILAGGSLAREDQAAYQLGTIQIQRPGDFEKTIQSFGETERKQARLLPSHSMAFIRVPFRTTTFLLRQTTSFTNAQGVLSWWGQPVDELGSDRPGSATLAIERKETSSLITGILTVDGKTFQIQPVGADKVLVMPTFQIQRVGADKVLVTPGYQFPPEHGGATPHPFKSAHARHAAKPALPKPAATVVEPALIRILFAYTSAVEACSNVVSIEALALDTANQSFGFPSAAVRSGSYAPADVQVAALLTNVASIKIPNYVESAGMAKDLARFQDPNDGFMDEIHRLRDETRADVCVLLVAADPANAAYNLCGLASTIYATPSTAFCVVNARCVANFSVAHEIGHLMGARHNLEIDDNSVPFVEGHGIYWTNQWRCIMSYMGTPDDAATPRTKVWTTPGGTFIGRPMGDEHQNNVKVLNETAPIISRFR